MHGVFIRGIAAGLAFVAIACGDSDDTGGGAGGSGGTAFRASVVFANVLVGDGDESTDVDFSIEGVGDTNVGYLSSTRLGVTLAEQATEVEVEVRASSDQQVLATDGTIALVADRSRSVYAVGELGAAGTFAPALVPLEALGEAAAGSFRTRAIHATAGFEAAVDVYANGAAFLGVGYGSASDPIEAAIGAPDTDSLVVTEAGVPPNEATDLFRSVGQTLFEDGGRYDLVVTREPSGVNGDVNGMVTVWIAEESE